MLGRNKLAMLTAEFLGTGILTLVVLSVQRSQLGLAYFVAIAAGLTVGLLTYIFSNASGAHLNPALTLALWTARRVKTPAAILYVAVQLLGAWAGYGLYRYFVNTDVQQVTQAFNGRIMVAEAIATAVFAFAWAAAAYNRYENSRFAAVAGLSFTMAIIIASAASVGLANPALAVGVRAWEVFGENGWGNYVLGPVLGGVIGVNLYGLLFADVSTFSGLRRRNKTAAAWVSSSTVDDDEADTEVEVEKPLAKVDRKAKEIKAKKAAAKKTAARSRR